MILFHQFVLNIYFLAYGQYFDHYSCNRKSSLQDKLSSLFRKDSLSVGSSVKKVFKNNINRVNLMMMKIFQYLFLDNHQHIKN